MNRQTKISQFLDNIREMETEKRKDIYCCAFIVMAMKLSWEESKAFEEAFDLINERIEELKAYE